MNMVPAATTNCTYCTVIGTQSFDRAMIKWKNAIFKTLPGAGFPVLYAKEIH